MGNELVKLWWGGDPDKLDPVSGLSKRDIYNIRRSWTPMRANSETVGRQLFKRMFRFDKNMLSVFRAFRNIDEETIAKSTPFGAHVIGFMAAMSMVIDHLHRPDLVIPMLHTLGGQHIRGQVPTQYFHIADDIMLDYLRNDHKLSPSTVESWRRFLTFMNPHIFHGLEPGLLKKN